MSASRWAAVTGAALLLLGLPGPAEAAPPSAPGACIAQSEKAQLDRDEGRFLDARGSFVACASEECPRVVRRDCVEFLAEVFNIFNQVNWLAPGLTLGTASFGVISSAEPMRRAELGVKFLF